MSSSRSKRQFQGQMSQNLILINTSKKIILTMYSRHSKSPKMGEASLLGQAWHLASIFHSSIIKVLSKDTFHIYFKRSKTPPFSKMAKVTHSVQKKRNIVYNRVFRYVRLSGMTNLNMADSCIRWNNKLISSCDRREADSWCWCPL